MINKRLYERFEYRWYNKRIGLFDVIKIDFENWVYIFWRHDYESWWAYSTSKFSLGTEKQVFEGSNKHCILSQYTWLKCKNWKKIYEWDIIWCYQLIWDFAWWYEPIWKIKRDDDFCGFVLDNVNWGFSDFIDLISDRNYLGFEVIWNIYENPDLIKE